MLPLVSSWIGPKWIDETVGWVLFLGFFGEFFFLSPIAKPEPYRSEINQALKTGALSRWIPFVAGGAGTIFCSVATILIWLFPNRWEVDHLGDARMLAALITWILGIAGGLAFTSETAKARRGENEGFRSKWPTHHKKKRKKNG